MLLTTYRTETPKNMVDIQWRIAVPENVDRDSWIYFLRTNVADFDERTTWDYYNLTREIECTNRQLKTDLNLRPIYHQKIVRIMSTQKAVTTEATNALGEKVHMRICSEPTLAVKDIYERLKYKKMPFRKIKIEKSL